MPKMNERLVWIAAVTHGILLCASPMRAQERSCTATPDGVFCETTERIIGGNVIDAATQRRLGLVTLTNNCSGTLINREWVLTTDHCVAGGEFGGPSLPSIRIRAAWSAAIATPTRFVRPWYRRDNRDLALIFLGAGDLGVVNGQAITGARVIGSDTLTKFGQGIFRYAIAGTAGASDTPAQQDGQYRNAPFVRAW